MRLRTLMKRLAFIAFLPLCATALLATPPKAGQKKPSQPAPAPTATPAPTPTPPITPDQVIEVAAATIVDDAGAPFVERIDWSEDTGARAPAAPQVRVYLAPKPWHRSPRSLKRDVIERLIKLDWRSCSWAGLYSSGVFARVYVGETLLGRIEITDSSSGVRDDYFVAGPAWADQ